MVSSRSLSKITWMCNALKDEGSKMKDQAWSPHAIIARVIVYLLGGSFWSASLDLLISH